MKCDWIRNSRYDFVMAKKTRSNQHGFSILEVLIALGIMGVVSAGLMTLVVNMQKESRAIAEGIAARDLAQTLIRTLGDGSVCEYLLTKPVVLKFNSTAVSPTTPQTLTPTLPIYSTITPAPGPIVAQVGAQASAYSSTLVVSSINLQITNGVGNSFTGNWVINFDPTKSVRPIRPVTVTASITADISVPTAAIPVSCSGAAGGALHQDPTKCIQLYWGAQNQPNFNAAQLAAEYGPNPVPTLPLGAYPGKGTDIGAWAVCPVGFYVAGVTGVGITTGTKRDFGRVLCCPP